MLQVMEMNKPPFKFKFVNMSVLKNNPAAEVKCHICGLGGHLYECAYCPRSYHIMCVPSTIDISPEGWRCMYHFCGDCGSSVDYSEADLYHCEHCKTSFCSTHKNNASLRTIGEKRDHVVLCNNCQDYSGLSEPPRKKMKIDSPTSVDSFYKPDLYEGRENQGLWRQRSDPGYLNARLNEDPSEENFKSEPSSPQSPEATTPTSTGSISNENTLQSRISATASRNLVSALKDMMKLTKKNQKMISQEIGISTTTLSGLVTGKRRTKGWKTLEYKLVKWILSQTVDKTASEHNAEYQRNVQTLQKIQRGFKQYLDDVYKNKDSDKHSDRGSSSSPDPSQESPRNPKPPQQTPASSKPISAPGQAPEQSANTNTNVPAHYQPGATTFYSPQPEYFTDYSAPPQPIGDVNMNIPQQVPYRSDEPMYDRNYEDEPRQFHAHLPHPQGMTGVSMPLEFVHERLEVQRSYFTYPTQEYMNTTDPHGHAYGSVPNVYRPPTNFQYQPYFVQQPGSGMAPHSINLQPMQQQQPNVHMNNPNYSNVLPSNTNYSAQSNLNQANENVPQDYEDE